MLPFIWHTYGSVMGKKNQTVKHPETHGSDMKLMESKPEPGIDMD